MTASTFNTLAAARDLEAAGIERRHAEAIAEAIDRGDECAASKADLDALRAELRADFNALDARLVRALWIQGGAIVAILAALRFLPV